MNPLLREIVFAIDPVFRTDYHSREGEFARKLERSKNELAEL